ncbi:hypothetical protein BD779DRAFT_1474154 [Infundibulicybe gibba]|nr:hypothetical protein BD779DRAFT_1474154 [Infundibulicybe gibba]
MLFKTFSLCALILSGAASAVAQALQPGTYTITSVSAGPDANREGVLLRSPGPNQLAVIPDVQSSVIEGSDKWNLAPGQNGGFIIENALFGGFLTVGPNNNALVVGTTEDLNQATSFAITPAGNGAFHVGSNQINFGIAGLTHTLCTSEDSGGCDEQFVDRPVCCNIATPGPRLADFHPTSQWWAGAALEVNHRLELEDKQRVGLWQIRAPNQPNFVELPFFHFPLGVSITLCGYVYAVCAPAYHYSELGGLRLVRAIDA